MSNKSIIPLFIKSEPHQHEPASIETEPALDGLSNHDPNDTSPEEIHNRTTSNTSTTLSSVHDPTNPNKAHFFSRPIFAPLIFDNTTSEARDLDAAERNFLSWVRLAMVLAVSGTAVIVNLRFMDFGSKGLQGSTNQIKYHFSSAPSFHSLSTSDLGHLDSWDSLLHIVASESLTTNFSIPLGVIFYVLSILCLLSAAVTYISSVNGYVNQYIVVTNSLSILILVSIIALAIIVSNILLLTQGSFV
jgi:uncharacterized membrane protein YidH (DUF202 family)